MAIHVKRRWHPELGAGLPRRDRRGCDYDAYVPDPLVGRPISLGGEAAADAADAESAITHLNLEARTLASSEALARVLLRADAVASSWMEGLEIGGRRLLRAEAARALGDDPSDMTAVEVLGNLNAMAWAVDTVARAQAITLDHIREIHRRLLEGTRLAMEGGRLREGQNWIGGSNYNPCNAAFIPPPPEHVAALLTDLCDFCSNDSLPTVVQAAIAHAQFETIHPFADGNGRTGRALIHVILRRRGLAPRVLPPISLVLATWSNDYIAGLTATRYLGDPSSAEARDGLNRWIGLFSAAGKRAVDDARSFEVTVGKLQDEWRKRLTPVRRGSAADLLVSALPGAPILTVNSASQLIGRSFQATNEAIRRLVHAGVLREARIGRRRNRAFEATEIIGAFTDLERRLASPRGDTRMAPVARRAPAGPG